MTFLTALADGRSAAEQMMNDRIRVDRKTGDLVLDEDTGREEPVVEVVYASLKAKMQSASLVASTVDVGGQVAATTRSTVHVPVAGTEQIRTDDVLVFLSVGSYSDQALIGASFRVVGPAPKSYATARRLTVEEVTS